MNDTEILIYTDGGCRNHGNQKNQHVQATDPAAWAYLIKQGAHIIHADTKGYYGQTNNAMELRAILQALTWAKKAHYQNEPIHLISDSKYFINALDKKWLNNWKAHQWRKSQGGPIANQMLWIQISQVLDQFTEFTYSWTHGHAENSGNNYVDMMVNHTMDKLS